jgi:hypothetical protein
MKKLKKYKVKINISGFPQKTLEVQGESVNFQGKEYISLFVYFLPSISFGDKTCMLADCWHVAEETSGMSISNGLTKQIAISCALAKLNRYSKEKTLEQINKHKLA